MNIGRVMVFDENRDIEASIPQSVHNDDDMSWSWSYDKQAPFAPLCNCMWKGWKLLCCIRMIKLLHFRLVRRALYLLTYISCIEVYYIQKIADRNWMTMVFWRAFFYSLYGTFSTR